MKDIKYTAKNTYQELLLSDEYCFLTGTNDNEDTFVLAYIKGNSELISEHIKLLSDKDLEIADLKKQIAIIVEDRDKAIAKANVLENMDEQGEDY